MFTNLNVLIYYNDKNSISWEMIMTRNLYVPNNLSLNYIKQILTEVQRKTGKSTIVVRYFHIPLSVVGR